MRFNKRKQSASDPTRAVYVFEQRGTLVVEGDVLMINGDNKPNQQGGAAAPPTIPFFPTSPDFFFWMPYNALYLLII